MSFFKKIFKPIGKVVGGIFGTDSSGMRRAAEQQAAAIRQASAQQALQSNQQAQGAALAQQAAANQAHLAARLRAQEQDAALAPQTRIEGSTPLDAAPRRRYRRPEGGAAASAHGLGIRLT